MSETAGTGTFERHHARLTGFDGFFAKELSNALEQREAERRRHVRPVLIKAAGIAVAALVVFYLAFVESRDEDLTEALLYVGMLVLMLGWMWVSKPLRRARQAGSTFLIEGVCRFLGLRFTSEVGDFAFSDFGSNSLVPSHDRKHLEDRIQGEHDGVAFDLIEAKLEQRRTSTDSKGRTRTYYVTVFNGLLISVVSPRVVQGRTLVTGDAGKLGNLFGGLFRKDERISLESPEFERHFEVYGSDQVEARVLLTPAVLERLVTLKENLKATPRLCFLGTRLLMAVPRKGDQFEAGGLFSRLTDRAHIDEALAELCAIFAILDILELRQSASA